jgi:hypothetical protein
MQDASEDTGTQPAQRKRSTVTHVTKTRPISPKRSRFHTRALQRSQARLSISSCLLRAIISLFFMVVCPLLLVKDRPDLIQQDTPLSFYTKVITNEKENYPME